MQWQTPVSGLSGPAPDVDVTPALTEPRKAARRAPMVRTPPRMSPEERDAKKITRARSGGMCEICGRPAESWAHRRARSHGGLWIPANGLHLCGLDSRFGCHGWTEQHPKMADIGGWRFVHRDPDPETVPAYLPLHGGWCLLGNRGGVERLVEYGPKPVLVPERWWWAA